MIIRPLQRRRPRRVSRPSQSVTVLYDADCGFCRRSITTLERLGATATFTPLHAGDLSRLGVDGHRATREMPAVLAGGGIVYGAPAFAAALRTGPWWMRLLGRLIEAGPVAALAQAVYRWVSAHRQHLPAGTATCVIPQAPAE